MNTYFLTSNFNHKLERKYGSVEYGGKKYILTDYAEPTSRVLADHQRDYFELSAPAIDEEGNECILYWIFEDDGRELDMYDYDNIDRVEML
jgi:hypothetical protein